MRLLVVTNMYPSAEFPTDGIFIKRQVQALVAASPGLDVQVCHVDTVRRKLRYLTGALTIARAVRSFRPDLIHVHYGLSQILCWHIRSIPMVITFHGSDLTIPWQRRIGLALLRRRSSVVVVADRLMALLGSRQDAVLIPCGVDSNLFAADRAASRARFGIGRDEVVLLFGSNPDRGVKRYDRFLATAAELGKSITNLRSCRLSDVEVGDVPQWLACADVLMLTSDREGSPVVSKEALCSGVRVVSTRVGDVEDQLRAFSGCRVTEHEVSALARGVKEALSEPPPDGAAAARRFDLGNEVRNLMALYRRVVRA